MIYNPENIRLREVDSRSGRRSRSVTTSVVSTCATVVIRFARWVSLRLNCFLCVRGV